MDYQTMTLQDLCKNYLGGNMKIACQLDTRNFEELFDGFSKDGIDRFISKEYDYIQDAMEDAGMNAIEELLDDMDETDLEEYK